MCPLHNGFLKLPFFFSICFVSKPERQNIHRQKRQKINKAKTKSKHNDIYRRWERKRLYRLFEKYTRYTTIMALPGRKCERAAGHTGMLWLFYGLLCLTPPTSLFFSVLFVTLHFRSSFTVVCVLTWSYEVKLWRNLRCPCLLSCRGVVKRRCLTHHWMNIKGTEWWVGRVRVHGYYRFIPRSKFRLCECLVFF